MGSVGGDDDDDEEEDDDELENEEASSLSDDDDDDAAWTPRARLPAPQPVNQSFSLFSILRHAIGKDLTKISLPATINQPLTIIQRTVEDLEYINLLYDALDARGINRMTALVAFCVSAFGGWYWRKEKPFADAGRDVRLDEPGRARARARRTGGIFPAGVRVARGGHVAGDAFEMTVSWLVYPSFGALRSNFWSTVPAHATPRHRREVLWEKAAMHAQRHLR